MYTSICTQYAKGKNVKLGWIASWNSLDEILKFLSHVDRRLALDSVSWSVFLVCREDRAACVREASSCLTHLPGLCDENLLRTRKFIVSRHQWIGECFKTRNLRDSYNTCEDPAYFRWGFLWICRTICPASCPVIRIFLLEQKQTWRATGLLVPVRVRTHETTPGLAALWLGTK